MSSTSQNQQRNPQLKPISVSSTGAYSASPSQLTLSSDATTAYQHNPYQQQHYTYASPHQQVPGGFAFPQQTHYSPHPLQAQHQLPPQHQQQPPPQSLSTVSPTISRKRRASELGGGESALSASSSSTFTGPSGLVTNAYGAPLEQIDSVQGGPVNTQLPSPGVARKGRTNTPWTPAEEQRLKTMRDAGSSWSEIAKTFPLRTEGSVKKHWYKDMHYAEFAEDESATLLQAIKHYENNKWKVIGQKVGKPAKACEQFAKEQGWKV
ncbi:hypothetical protein LTR78_003378 [Recurvomyces mirabilis]|uniref:Myb-like domain-containing protein n=1 Tax=Recurvomyces mirabilis TaxID=574656 RepID=A0AAE0WRC1_9PEZI|nr:hypothetical protein LTR78_003378 [Recurvomyces mirabilis]KAK5154586.1 hypothetical protein LTS14_006724 [Recurvomyces mirabilis]